MESGSKTIKVISADDHAIVREGLEKIISKAGDIEVVGQADNGVELLKIISEREVDVILMDIEMPEKNGWEVLAEVKKDFPKLPVIVFSIFEEEHYGTRFIRAGASGYVNKKSAPTQLVDAIRKVAQGGVYLSSQLAEKLIQDQIQVSEKPLHETLSNREFQIFNMIASGKKLNVIANELNVGVQTVSTYRIRLLKKMNMESNADIVRYALENNLIQ